MVFSSKEKGPLLLGAETALSALSSWIRLTPGPRRQPWLWRAPCFVRNHTLRAPLPETNPQRSAPLRNRKGYPKLLGIIFWNENLSRKHRLHSATLKKKVQRRLGLHPSPRLRARCCTARTQLAHHLRPTRSAIKRRRLGALHARARHLPAPVPRAKLSRALTILLHASCSCSIVCAADKQIDIMLSIAAMSSTTFAGLAAKAPMPVQMKAFDGLSYANSMAGIMPAETPGGDVGVFDPAGFLKQDNLTEEKVLFYREVELKHGRLAM